MHGTPLTGVLHPGCCLGCIAELPGEEGAAAQVLLLQRDLAEARAALAASQDRLAEMEALQVSNGRCQAFPFAAHAACSPTLCCMFCLQFLHVRLHACLYLACLSPLPGFQRLACWRVQSSNQHGGLTSIVHCWCRVTVATVYDASGA